MREIRPHNFQQRSAAVIAERFQMEYPSEHAQIIGHSAPTGSGKTITMICLVEELILGRIQGLPPRPDLRVLWVSDSPQLNIQTQGKFQRFSDVIPYGSTYTIDDDTFDEEYLRPGTVGFINTQKLASPGRLNRIGNLRHYTFWDSLNNSLRDYFEDVLVIIDEAHIGTRVRNHRSIVSNFLDATGEGAELHRPPKVIGISATIDRFRQYTADLGRPWTSVDISVSEVRVTGLLKDRFIVVNDGAFSALLVQSVVQFNEMSRQWEEYCNTNPDDPLVEPLLCIQVRNGTDGALSDTDLDEVVATLQECGLNIDDSIFHCFSNAGTHTLGGVEVPYINPSEVSGRADVRIILFKTAIITGWDCPRAEVLISDRTSEDYTVVSQLIGRIVRAPLQRRILSNDSLNEIHLLLPNFDEDAVSAVLSHLRGEEAIELESVVQPVFYYPREEMVDAMNALSGLPNYRLRRFPMRQPEHRRLLELCSLLEADGLSEQLRDSELNGIVNELIRHHNVRIDGGSQSYTMGEEFTHTQFTFDVLEGIHEAVGTIEIQPTEESFDRTHRENARLLSDDICTAFARSHPGTFEEATVDLNTLLSHGDEHYVSISEYCQRRIDYFREEEQEAIRGLHERSRERYDTVLLVEAIPELFEFNPPESLRLSASEDTHSNHFYVDDGGQFRDNLNNLEQDTLAYIREQEGFVGWYRNPSNQTDGLRIPYREQDTQSPYQVGTHHGKYPDFISIRKIGGSYIVDIYEPHDPGVGADGSWLRIACGFAHFAELHGDAFGVICMSCRHNGSLRHFDFNDARVRSIVYESPSFQDFLDAYSTMLR